MSRTVNNPVNEHTAPEIIRFTQNLGRNADKEAPQLACIPLLKYIGHLRIVTAARIFEQEIRFCNELHIRIFDAVVYHLDIVTRTVRTHIGTAGNAVRRTCCDRLKKRCDIRIGISISPGHNGGAKARAAFSAGNADAEIEQPL